MIHGFKSPYTDIISRTNRLISAADLEVLKSQRSWRNCCHRPCFASCWISPICDKHVHPCRSISNCPFEGSSSAALWQGGLRGPRAAWISAEFKAHHWEYIAKSKHEAWNYGISIGVKKMYCRRSCSKVWDLAAIIIALGCETKLWLSNHFTKPDTLHLSLLHLTSVV